MNRKKEGPIPKKEIFHAKQKYLALFNKNLRIRERAVRSDLLIDIENKLQNIGPVKDLEDIIIKIGDPVSLAEELSNPDNWVIDVGKPLNPKVPIKPYFSPRGRIILATVFIIGLIFSFFTLTSGNTSGWISSGVLILFFTYWIVLSSLMNSYLGYFIMVKDVKKEGLRTEGLSRKELKLHVNIFLFISIIILLFMGFLPLFLNITSGTMSLPLAFSTFIAVIISCIIVFKEGKKVI